MGMTDFYPEIEPHEHGMLEVGDGNLVYWEKRIDDLYDWGRLSEEEFQARLDSVLKARRTLEVKRSKRQRDIDEFETRRREIEQIRTAIAEDRFHAVWRPSANKLRVTLFREADLGEPLDFVDDDAWREDEPAAVPTARKSKSAVGTLGMSKDGFDAAATEARFETEYDLRRVFDLFDIKVVVHDDFIEVRGAFPKPIEIDLEEMGSVVLLRSM